MEISHGLRAALLLVLAATPSLSAAPAAMPPPGLPEPVLIADLTAGGMLTGFAPNDLAAAGGRLYMSHDLSGYGYEPWISDGTAAGTRLLADVCPGECSSSPAGFTAIGDRVVFYTFESAGYHTLRSASPDGQLEILAERLLPSSYFEPIGGVLYFSARRPGQQSSQLFRTDGTAAGTVPAAELCGGDSDCITSFAPKAQGGRLFYHQDGALRVYSPAGGSQVLANLDGANSLVPFGDGRVLFRGCRGGGFCGMYTSDGSAAGTFELTFPGDSGGDNVLAFGDRAYFRDDARRIVSTDGRQPEARLEPGFGSNVTLLGTTASHIVYASGTAPNVEVRARGANGVATLLPTRLREVVPSGQAGGRFFFTYRDNQDREGFAATDGTPGGTFELIDKELDGSVVLPPPGGQALYGGSRATLGETFYFAFEPDGTTSGRLFRSDGTPAGTAAIDFTPRAAFSSFPKLYRQGRQILLYSSSDTSLRRVDPDTLAVRPLPSGFQLEAIAGSIAYVRDYAVLPPDFLALAEDDTATAFLPSGIGAGAVAPAPDGRLYFADGEPRVRLWETDGTAAGTRAVFDLAPVCAICARYLPAEITPSGERVFFVGEGAGENTFALWSWQRGAAPVSLVALPAALDLMPIGDGRVAFVTPLPFNGEESFDLWVSDGTVAGTRIVLSLPYAAYLRHWAATGTRLFFALDRYRDALPTSSLWVSDLTPGGNAELIAGAGGFTDLAASGEHLFFAGRSTVGVEPGFSDGTLPGTRWLDLVPGITGSGARNVFALADGRAVFAAAADEAGDELWITDGSTAGTTRLTDLAPGRLASSPGDFAEMPGDGGSRLFFAASEPQVGREAWALDLAPALPPCPEHLLCLQEGRFEVSVEVGAGGDLRPGGRVLGAANAGIFRFFSPDNWEMLVKVLDGCAINDAFWVYAAAATDVPYRLTVLDRSSGATRTYDSRGPARPILDSAAFASCGAEPQPPSYALSSAPLPAAHRCADDPAALCLGPAGRYRVSLGWSTAEAAGTAQPVPYGSAETGLFTFFSPDNWELLVKVLDGCAINGKIWVFGAGTTDVGWSLEVLDRQTGATRVYDNPLGQPSRTLADTAAFACN